eukprot:gene10277-13819_t
MNCTDYHPNEESSGPFRIDYTYTYNCLLSDYGFSIHVLFIIALILWSSFLMHMLASTASNYFSPTLSEICSKMNLAYDIAGVTFLAFGNGAPDFFSLVASFSGGGDVLVGVGALLGGSVFVCTVVVGFIAIICPCDVSRGVFIRDISFHLLATVFVTIVAYIKHIHLLFSISFIIVYIGYVFLVVLYSTGVSASTVGMDNLSNYIPMVDLGKNIQTAFWLPDANSNQNQNNSRKTNNIDRIDENNENGYSFLILDDYAGDNNNTETLESEKVGIINLTGGIRPNFDNIIMEDFYGDSNLDNDNDKSANYDLNEETIVFNHINTEGDETNNSLNESLLQPTKSTSFRSKGKSSDEFMSTLYWNQWMLRQHFHKQIALSDWWNYPIAKKTLFLVAIPLECIRDMTIPTLDRENWSKLYAMLHPYAVPIFLIVILQLEHTKFLNIPTPILFLIIGTPFSFGIYVMTHNNKPPTGRLFGILWALVAFVMCVAWVYTLAGELILVLSAMGTFLRLPPSFLGLTVLAWGNSIGDFFTNTAVAKQGLGKMAIAGCYGGPVFNILVGFGTALIYSCLTTYPTPYPVNFDKSTIISIIFLYIALISTIVIITIRQFRVEKIFGYYLVFLYFFYTAIQTVLLAVEETEAQA